jgi:hypothetical protein
VPLMSVDIRYYIYRRITYYIVFVYILLGRGCFDTEKIDSQYVVI